MDKYELVLQMCAIIVICFCVYLFARYLVSLIKKGRLSDYSLNLVSDYKNNIVVRLSRSISNAICFIPFVLPLTKKYDAYAKKDNMFKDGKEVLGFKILTSIFLMFLYLLVSALYKEQIYLIVILILLILGYVLPDFYFIFVDSKKYKSMDSDLLGCIIIMSNDFRANRSIEQAINDVIDRKEGVIQKEFKKVLSDTKLGLNYGEAFERMYKRTNNNIVLKLSYAFSLYNDIGSDLISVFDKLEKNLLDEEKLKSELNSIRVTNMLGKIIFGFIPILFIVNAFVVSDEYRDILLSNKGIVLIIILFVLFVIYIDYLNKVSRGEDDE